MTEPADITFERDDRGGVTVILDGHPQSHVQPDDPRLLAFEYVQHLAMVIDVLFPSPFALRVTHVGGAGLTLPRWVEATRPGSPQIVLEPNAALTEAVRRELPLPRRHRIRVRPLDGTSGVAALADESADLLVTDAFAGGRVPAGVVDAAHLGQVCRVLTQRGAALWNLADDRDLRWVGRVVATVRGTFPHVALVGLHEVLKRKRFGNVVLVASPAPLPVHDLRRACAGAALRTAVREGRSLDDLVAGARPFPAGEAVGSPEPPTRGVWRSL